MTKRLTRSTHLTRTAMTSKLSRQTKEGRNFEKFPSRDDMQNSAIQNLMESNTPALSEN